MRGAPLSAVERDDRDPVGAGTEVQAAAKLAEQNPIAAGATAADPDQAGGETAGAGLALDRDPHPSAIRQPVDDLAADAG